MLSYLLWPGSFKCGKLYRSNPSDQCFAYPGLGKILRSCHVQGFYFNQGIFLLSTTLVLVAFLFPIPLIIIYSGVIND